jgi:hypothetical protein
MTRRAIANRLPGLLLAAVLLAGCAGIQAVAVRNPQLGLRERGAQYWDARLKGDLLATYTLHEPAFRRAVTLTAFLQGRGMTPVLVYEILGERIEGDLGIVKVKIKSTVTHPKLVKPVEPFWAEFEEQWVRVDGIWYRKFRFPVGEPYPDVDWDDVAAKNRTSGSPPVR